MRTYPRILISIMPLVAVLAAKKISTSSTTPAPFEGCDDWVTAAVSIHDNRFLLFFGQHYSLVEWSKESDRFINIIGYPREIVGPHHKGLHWFKNRQIASGLMAAYSEKPNRVILIVNPIPTLYEYDVSDLDDIKLVAIRKNSSFTYLTKAVMFVPDQFGKRLYLWKETDFDYQDIIGDTDKSSDKTEWLLDSPDPDMAVCEVEGREGVTAAVALNQNQALIFIEGRAQLLNVTRGPGVTGCTSPVIDNSLQPWQASVAAMKGCQKFEVVGQNGSEKVGVPSILIIVLHILMVWLN